MMITLVLSSNMKRMLKNNVLVRKLVGIETAGSINILFTDKTGTLTKGKLEAIGFISGSLKKYNNDTELSIYPKMKNMLELSLIYNNESERAEDKIIGGNITDRALLAFSHETNIKAKVVNRTPFQSKNKYSQTLIETDKKMVEELGYKIELKED